MNKYIPVFDKITGDILVTTLPNQYLNLTEDCPERSFLPNKNIKLPNDFIKNIMEGKPVIPPPIEYLDDRDNII